jgi:Protein of unknown function (DUF2459)
MKRPTAQSSHASYRNASRDGIGRRALRAQALASMVPALLLGCGWTPVRPYEGGAAPVSRGDVIAAAWHTEIGVAAADIDGPLTVLVSDFPGARELVFGWGQREYYMAGHPGSGDLVGAAFPSAAVMLIIPVTTSPTDTFRGAEIVPVGISRPGLDRLSDYLWGYLEKGPDGRPIRVAPGPFPGSAFYASGATYHIARTCNTFTAEGLRVAGVRVHASGVILAHQVTDQLRSWDR